MISLHPEFLSKDGKLQFAVLPYEEFLQVQATLARTTERELADVKYGSPFDNLSAEELARRQGVIAAKAQRHCTARGTRRIGKASMRLWKNGAGISNSHPHSIGYQHRQLLLPP